MDKFTDEEKYFLRTTTFDGTLMMDVFMDKFDDETEKHINNRELLNRKFDEFDLDNKKVFGEIFVTQYHRIPDDTLIKCNSDCNIKKIPRIKINQKFILESFKKNGRKVKQVMILHCH